MNYEVVAGADDGEEVERAPELLFVHGGPFVRFPPQDLDGDGPREPRRCGCEPAELGRSGEEGSPRFVLGRTSCRSNCPSLTRPSIRLRPPTSKNNLCIHLLFNCPFTMLDCTTWSGLLTIMQLHRVTLSRKRTGRPTPASTSRFCQLWAPVAPSPTAPYLIYFRSQPPPPMSL
jgi:hypothetical protein